MRESELEEWLYIRHFEGTKELIRLKYSLMDEGVVIKSHDRIRNGFEVIS